MKCEEQELVSLTEFRRDLTGVVERLKSGTIEKAVLVKNGRFECVLLTVESYEKLVQSDHCDCDPDGHVAKDCKAHGCREARGSDRG